MNGANDGFSDATDGIKAPKTHCTLRPETTAAEPHNGSATAQSLLFPIILGHLVLDQDGMSFRYAFQGKPWLKQGIPSFIVNIRL